MNNPERLNEVCRWMRFAREDLEAAEALLASEDFVPRHACWLAQQAAEKVLKAALVPEGWRVRTEHPDLAELTEWAVEARYPGDWADATVEAAQRAGVQARAVYDCIVADLHARGIRCGEMGGF